MYKCSINTLKNIFVKTFWGSMGTVHPNRDPCIRVLQYRTVHPPSLRPVHLFTGWADFGRPYAVDFSQNDIIPFSCIPETKLNIYEF